MKNKKRLLCGALVFTMAATTVFANGPMTKAETYEIVQDASENYANGLTIHVKGTGMKIHAWDGSGPVTGEWPPQTVLTDEGNGWCSISLEKSIVGFLICDASGKNITGDVTDKTSGEWWYDGSTWSEKNPNGDTKPTATPTPTDKDDPTPTPTKPAEKDGKVTINSVTPKSGEELEAGEECNIKVDAETDINDEVLYYKFEVTCDGKYVEPPHYTKESTFTFTPESGKKYKVAVFVQAHDEDNTTETVTCTYTTSGEVEDNPTETVTPTKTPGAGETEDPENPEDPTKPEKTQAPEKTKTPTDPEKTKAPTKTASPTPTPTATATATATVKPTGTPTSNVNTDNTANGSTNLGESSNVDIKITCSKNSPLILGKSVLLEAKNSTSATGLTYRFSVKKSGQTATKVLQEYSSDNTCVWKPSSKGTYTIIVECKEGSKEAVSTSATYVVKGLGVSAKASSTSVKKGKKVKISASASNANGSVKYKYIVKLGKKKVASTGYKAKKTYSFKASKKGTYTVSVYAKDLTTVVTKTIKVKAK